MPHIQHLHGVKYYIQIFNNVLTHHFWLNKVDRQKKISQPLALIQIRVWTLSMCYYTFMEKFAPMLLVML